MSTCLTWELFLLRLQYIPLTKNNSTKFSFIQQLKIYNLHVSPITTLFSLCIHKQQLALNKLSVNLPLKYHRTWETKWKKNFLSQLFYSKKMTKQMPWELRLIKTKISNSISLLWWITFQTQLASCNVLTNTCQAKYFYIYIVLANLLWIFFDKKLKYLKNWMTCRKTISEFGVGTNEEKNAKTAAFNFEICGRR